MESILSKKSDVDANSLMAALNATRETFGLKLSHGQRCKYINKKCKQKFDTRMVREIEYIVTRDNAAYHRINFRKSVVVQLYTSGHSFVEIAFQLQIKPFTALHTFYIDDIDRWQQMTQTDNIWTYYQKIKANQHLVFDARLAKDVNEAIYHYFRDDDFCNKKVERWLKKLKIHYTKHNTLLLVDFMIYDKYTINWIEVVSDLLYDFNHYNHIHKIIEANKKYGRGIIVAGFGVSLELQAQALKYQTILIEGWKLPT